MIHVDAALGEQLLQIPVRRAVAQVPANREQGHVRWETETDECRRSLNGRPRMTVALHRATLTDLW
jgi:hypothetical protein